MAKDIIGMETTCVSSVNIVGTIIKDRYQSSKAGPKIMLDFIT